MRTLIIVSVLVSVFPAFAHSEEQVGRVDLEVTTNSIHFEKRKDGREWNQKNTGFGLEYVFPPGTLWGKDIEYAVTAGTIKNSEFGQTIFAGGCVTKPILKWSSGRISVSAFVGALNYPSKFNLQQKAGDIIPAILPTLTVALGKRFYFDATFIPKVQQNQGSAAVLFGVSIKGLPFL